MFEGSNATSPRWRRLRLTSAALYTITSAALFTSCPTWADPTDASDEGAADSDANLVEVVVTAERRENKAQNVPIAVSAVTGDTLEKAGFNDPGQLRFLAPGLG